MKTLGIYIHIPFCISKCAYCDFYSLADCNRTEEYIEALKTQIKSFKARRGIYGRHDLFRRRDAVLHSARIYKRPAVYR